MGHSIIDLTIANDRALNMIKGWHVDITDSFSDHRYIKMSLCLSVFTEKRGPHRNLNKADWAAFQERLSWHPNPPTTHLEQEATRLEAEMKEALDLACPLTTRPGRKPQPWWNPELSKQRTEAKKLFKQWKSGNGSEHAYKEARDDYHNMKYYKRCSWREFCGKDDGNKHASKLIKILKANQRDIGILKKDDDSYCQSPEETMDLLMRTHLPGCVEVNDNYEARVARKYTNPPPRSSFFHKRGPSENGNPILRTSKSSRTGWTKTNRIAKLT